MKSMTKAARKRHIQSNGCDVYETGCLYCKAGGEEDDPDQVVLEYEPPEPVESGDLEQKVTCRKCGRKWIDVFQLAEVREIV